MCLSLRRHPPFLKRCTNKFSLRAHMGILLHHETRDSPLRTTLCLVSIHPSPAKLRGCPREKCIVTAGAWLCYERKPPSCLGFGVVRQSDLRLSVLMRFLTYASKKNHVTCFFLCRAASALVWYAKSLWITPVYCNRILQVRIMLPHVRRLQDSVAPVWMTWLFYSFKEVSS